MNQNEPDIISSKNRESQITGTLIWYYFICHREVWLMAHQLEAFQDNSFLELGRFFQKETYLREKKNIRLENIELDLIKRTDRQVVVGEVKKSSRFEQSAKMQLAYYLKILREYGINAQGELLFPKEKKRLKIQITDDILKALNEAEAAILKIINMEIPPPPEKISFCKHCAYYEFCWI